MREELELNLVFLLNAAEKYLNIVQKSTYFLYLFRTVHPTRSVHDVLGLLAN